MNIDMLADFSSLQPPAHGQEMDLPIQKLRTLTAAEARNRKREHWKHFPDEKISVLTCDSDHRIRQEVQESKSLSSV
jgi:hypothetical protein